MRRFNICYTGWFNYQHELCGHLYQGRYKAILVDADNYLLELSRYIHLNPVRTKKLRKSGYREQLQQLKNYQWSSLSGFLDKRYIVNFIDYNMILSMVGGRHAYQVYIHDGMRDGVKNPFKDVQYQTILGCDTFVKRAKSRYIKKGSLREQPMYRDLVVEKIEPGIVLQWIIEVMGVTRDELNKHTYGSMIRGIAAEMLYKYSGLKQVQIGQVLGGIDYGAVYQLRRRIKEQLAHNKVLKSQYNEIENKIRKSVEC
jgi:hypothetical protein